VFWIWDENNVDKLLMFVAVAKDFSASARWPGLPGAREAGRGHS